MTTNAPAQIVTVECPRCSGVGYLLAFSHIKKGLCFLCAGAGNCDVRVAADWRKTHAPTVDTRPVGKVITLPTLGSVTIRKGEGAFTGLFSLSTMSAVGELRSWFGVTNGRVWLDSVCGGHVGAFMVWGCESELGDGYIRGSVAERNAEFDALGHLKAALQAALKK